MAEEDQEFLAAVAAHGVVGADRRRKLPSYFSQNRISDEMAVIVIDLFEMVDIAEKNRSRAWFSRNERSSSVLIKERIEERFQIAVRSS